MIDGDGSEDCEPGMEHLVALYTRQKARREEFSDAQLAALDALWRAKRDGHVTDEEGMRIEELIRAGDVHSARKDLTRARRNAATPDNRRNGTDASG